MIISAPEKLLIYPSPHVEETLFVLHHLTLLGRERE
jgi:hypothetical protein